MITYTDNKNPIVGIKTGSKQEISVYDKNLGNRRILSAAPEKIDEYVSQLKTTKKSNKKKVILTSALSGILSTIPFLFVTLNTHKPMRYRRVALLTSITALAASAIGNTLFAEILSEHTKQKLNQKFIEENK